MTKRSRREFVKAGAVVGLAAVSRRTEAAPLAQAAQGPTEPFPNLWGAFVYGVSTGTTNTARLADGLDRAFAQSPYLAVP